MNSSRKQLWCLVGGNGSGKSTFYQQALSGSGIPFVNADLIAAQFHQTAPEAQALALQTVTRKLELGETFCFETVFSHESKVDLIRKAKSLGYEVILVFVHLSTSDLNQLRVQQRVAIGGHDVPADRIVSRIPRTVENVKMVIGEVDTAILIDNSRDGRQMLREVAIIKTGKVAIAQMPLPAWAEEILAALPS